MRMSRNPRAIDRAGATQRVRELFERDDRGLSSVVTEALKILAKVGFDFEDRFLVGFFKGLMVLYGERYVDDATFRAILGDEIQRLLRSHPAAVANLVKQRLSNRARRRSHS